MQTSNATSHFSNLSQEDNISKDQHFLSISTGLTGLFWLAISLIFTLIESMKLHAPEVINTFSWMNYGRIHQISQITFIGAIIHLLLWFAFSQIALLGQSPKRCKYCNSISICFLNISIISGCLEILTGNNNNLIGCYPLFSLLFFGVSFFFAAFNITKTLHQLNSLSITQLWTTLPFWIIPFTLVTIGVILRGNYLSGAYGSWISSWFSHHIHAFLLLPLGIALLLEYTQQVSQKTFKNTSPLTFSFWVYVFSNLLITSDASNTVSTFVPAWLKALDTVGNVFSSFALISLAVCVYQHIKPQIASLKNNSTFSFFAFAEIALVTLGVLRLITSFRTVANLTQFTTITSSLQTLLYFGFICMIFLAWIYDQLPLLLNRVWASHALIKTHFWVTGSSTVLASVGLLSAGVIQAYRHNYSEATFLDTLTLIKPLLWTQSLSLVFQFSGILMTIALFFLILMNWRPNPKNSLF